MHESIKPESGVGATIFLIVTQRTEGSKKIVLAMIDDLLSEINSFRICRIGVFFYLHIEIDSEVGGFQKSKHVLLSSEDALASSLLDLNSGQENNLQ